MDEATKTAVARRLDELMGLLAWLRTQQAKLGGLGKIDTVEKIIDGIERISQWAESGKKAREDGGEEGARPARSPVDADPESPGRFLESLSEVEQGVRAMTEGKASLTEHQVKRVETGLKEMAAMLNDGKQHSF